jgi:hypothetical protein
LSVFVISEAGNPLAEIRHPDPLKRINPYLAVLRNMDICMVGIGAKLAFAYFCLHFLFAKKPAQVFQIYGKRQFKISRFNSRDIFIIGGQHFTTSS